MTHRPLVMAHRGDMTHAPENSLAGFRLAIEAQAELLETDLWFTSDGDLVLHHDETLERMTGDLRRVSAVTSAEARRLRLHSRWPGYQDERIPGLDDLLDLAPPDLILVLELKDPAFADPARCRDLADRIRDRVLAERAMVVSFHMDRLAAMKQVLPEIRTGHITGTNPIPWQPTEMVGAYYPLLLLNPLYVAMAHARGRWVCVLDNRPDDHLLAYLRWGVDCVLSDNPSETKRRLDSLTWG